MLSIIDLRDFVDLDIETVRAVQNATQLPDEEAITLARQFLATEQGVTILHHMFRDQIASAAAAFNFSREQELRQAYTYFSRKYPIPEVH